MTLDDFLAPLGETRFMAKHYGRAPVHIPAAGGRLDFPWARMNQLFQIAPHWTTGNLKLILNSRAVDPAFTSTRC